MTVIYRYKVPDVFTPGLPKMTMEWQIEIEGLAELGAAINKITPMMSKVADESAEKLVDEWLRWVGIGTRTWSEAPRFVIERARVAFGGDPFSVSEAAMDIDITDKPFMWVDQGTKGPYPIPKSGSGRLRFQTGYTAKTVMGSAIGSLPGGPTGPFVIRPRVMHKGLKPRNISGKALEIVEKGALNIVEKVADDYLGGWWTPGVGIAR